MRSGYPPVSKYSVICFLGSSTIQIPVASSSFNGNIQITFTEGSNIQYPFDVYTATIRLLCTATSKYPNYWIYQVNTTITNDFPNGSYFQYPEVDEKGYAPAMVESAHCTSIYNTYEGTTWSCPDSVLSIMNFDLKLSRDGTSDFDHTETFTPATVTDCGPSFTVTEAVITSTFSRPLNFRFLTVVFSMVLWVMFFSNLIGILPFLYSSEPITIPALAQVCTFIFASGSVWNSIGGSLNSTIYYGTYYTTQVLYILTLILTANCNIMLSY